MTASLPAPYFWLWHLVALGVIDVGKPGADGPAPVTGTRWDDLRQLATSGRPATVALIDTGTSRRHPNLAGNIDPRSIDLTSHRYGARYDGPASDDPYKAETPARFLDGLSLANLTFDGLEPGDLGLLGDLVADLAHGSGVIRHLADPEEAISSHGTGCAGLLVGHPALVAPSEGPDPVLLDGRQISHNVNVLPYFGVDPYSKLLSIRTSFEPEAVQFITAFLYAHQMGVQAIVLPRGLPDPKRSLLDHLFGTEPKRTWHSRDTDDLIERLKTPGDARDPSASQNGHDPDRLWRILEQVVVAVSKNIPIFCAAGNDAESQVIYPACLADESNGIFAVGAVTSLGRRSGYSNYGKGLTLVMPSDDFEVLNRHQKRIDKSDPLIGMHDFSAVTTATEVEFSPLELLTTDLPGVFGYDPGAAPWSSITDPAENPGAGGGYYTSFGGTSGASCLAGGLALLAQRAWLSSGGPDAKPLTGIDIKRLMTDPETTTIRAVLPEGNRMTGDEMNPGDAGADLSRFFGKGLPHARKLIEKAMAYRS